MEQQEYYCGRRMGPSMRKAVRERRWCRLQKARVPMGRDQHLTNSGTALMRGASSQGLSLEAPRGKFACTVARILEDVVTFVRGLKINSEMPESHLNLLRL